MITDKIIEKITQNVLKIGDGLKEFPGNTEGYYTKYAQKSNSLPHIMSWTQSFFPGMALLAYTKTKDERLLKWVNSYYSDYEKKVFDTPAETMHDLGFLYSPYAVMHHELTGDVNMKKIAIQAADTLAKRYIPNGKYIRAWGRMDNKIPDYVEKEMAKDHFFTQSRGLAIIDCMMNLPLLFWASEKTGHPYYKNIAICHADTTMKYFVRDDYSVCHAYRFSEETGEPTGEESYCGFSIGSHWARGTAWAIYGFSIAYSYTKDEKYLELSINLLNKFLEESADDIPVWDFRLPKDKEPTLDTSAYAITLCAVHEILTHKKSDELLKTKDKMHKKLEEYINSDPNFEGILSEQNGIHHYTSYGDYFMVEAMLRDESPLKIW